ncbi:MAG TPA: DUF5990 family protein [Streptosporangiaceae bacterium]|nr:DUF5990 family protein [Streptosporangiaceae bacterium]
MPQLPDRPDLAQLRRQARELHRAAADGDPGALRRVRQVSEKTTLSTAQLALAREYGFPSWPRLRDEVLGAERRSVPAADGPGAPAPVKFADAGELIDDQYADRPQLRPILDAVLALLPALGPVTVQARKTLVSLVSPRRTFAVVRATTKDRVDLGLRLDGAEPGGRLQSAKGIGGGGATVRIALRRPEDIDDEARGLIVRAYEENTAPPPPRRPARRPGAVAGTMTVVIEGSELPGRTCRPEPDGRGHENVHVALGGRSTDRPSLTMSNKPGMAIEPVPGDAPAARWEMPVTVRRDDAGFDFAGPYVRGVRDDRHLGLIWGDLQGDGTLQVFRGAKLRLVDVDPGLVEQAIRPGRKLVARIRLTDARGNPICARVHPPYLTWSATGPCAVSGA